MSVMDCNDRIISEAAELFRLYGIKAVTMDALAQHLGISKRTIYEKFSDKDELLMAVIKCMMIRQREKIDEMLESSPNVIAGIFRMIGVMREHMRAMNPLIHSDLRKYHSAVLKKIREKCDYPDYKSPEHIINRGKEQGLFRKEVDSEIVGRSFEGLASMLTDRDLFPTELFTQRDLVKNIMVNYLRGISTPEGNEIINELEPGI